MTNKIETSLKSIKPRINLNHNIYTKDDYLNCCSIVFSFCRHDLIGIFSTTVNELKSSAGMTFEVSSLLIISGKHIYVIFTLMR